jgi:6-phosphogluconolactonase
VSYVYNLVYDDPEELGRAAAHYIVEVLSEAVRSRGHANVCLSGGSTPRFAYEAVASEHRDDLAWGHVHFWFGDERCVPPDHNDSNFRMADSAMLSRLPVALSNVHRIQGEQEPASAARAYDAELREQFADSADAPSFDLLLLGVGTDGHVASLFPGASTREEESVWAVAELQPHTPPKIPRVTLTPGILRRSRRVVFLVSGEGKRDVSRRVRMEDAPLPASTITGLEQTLWLMDIAAAPTFAG